MKPYYVDESVTLHHGDSLDVLRAMPDCSVDAVVTDPPYGLADHHPRTIATALAAWLGGDRDHVPDGKGFMGRDWDRFVPPPALWDECLRVVKPGGHLLAFAASRTADLMSLSVRLAGFEIRDTITWHYGNGFPKSLNVGKAIDKQRDDQAAVRVVCRWLRERIEQHPTHTVRDLAEAFGFHSRMVEHWAARDTDSQPTLPTLAQWDTLRDALGFGDEMDAEVLRLNVRKGEPGEAWAARPITGTVAEWNDRTNYAVTSRDGLRRDAPASDAARRWHGWGTALKPASEPIVVARKPLNGTVAQNVLAFGTGALNIDACRIGGADVPEGRVRHVGGTNSVYAQDTWTAANQATMGGSMPAGRWPSNAVLSHAPGCAEVCVHGCPVSELDAQSGVLTSGANPTRRSSDKFRDSYGEFKGQAECISARGADFGGASRFFPTFRYEAKASTAERPRDGAIAHPTVKPLDLMRWLVRLVTPPGGTVLEPFAGSGTTAEACVIEGFKCIAVERDETYLPLITARLTKPIQPALDIFGVVA